MHVHVLMTCTIVVALTACSSLPNSLSSGQYFQTQNPYDESMTVAQITFANPQVCARYMQNNPPEAKQFTRCSSASAAMTLPWRASVNLTNWHVTIPLAAIDENSCNELLKSSMKGGESGIQIVDKYAFSGARQ